LQANDTPKKQAGVVKSDKAASKLIYLIETKKATSYK
jgi:hypothetical protein